MIERLMFLLFIALLISFMLACGDDGKKATPTPQPRPTADYSPDDEDWWPK